MPRQRLAALLAGLLLGGALAWALGGLRPPVADDVVQQRADQALPLLPTDGALRQTLLPRHDGLSSVALQLARWQGAADDGAVTLRLFADDTLIAEQRWPTAMLSHNQWLTLDFAPQPHSASQQYTVEFRAEGGPFSVWGSALDVRAGEFEAMGIDSTVQELAYRTAYRLTPRLALAALGRGVATQGPLWLLALLVLPLPGLVLLVAFPRMARWDGAAWAALAVALGLALWPLIWAATHAVGFHWGRTSLLAVLALGWLAVLLRGWQQRHALPRLQGHHAALALLLIVAGAVRVLAVRDLAFPPWVDSVRHALITTIIADSGQIPTSYRPWLPIDGVPYHWGFHLLPAMLRQISGRPLPEILLALGQLLNTLAVLAMYGAGWLMTKRRSVALLAAFIVALPALFPAYYLTWGRYTQLAGMLLLPLLVAVTWVSTERRAINAEPFAYAQGKLRTQNPSPPDRYANASLRASSEGRRKEE
ncbi:MAG: hypothetical protein KDD73_14230, partial [Anaerolineales bacterium]|nr:hypothetical protein [Anaerolineales bacterium]